MARSLAQSRATYVLLGTPTIRDPNIMHGSSTVDKPRTTHIRMEGSHVNVHREPRGQIQRYFVGDYERPRHIIGQDP
jgi:hypothetical protein